MLKESVLIIITFLLMGISSLYAQANGELTIELEWKLKNAQTGHKNLGTLTLSNLSKQGLWLYFNEKKSQLTLLSI